MSNFLPDKYDVPQKAGSYMRFVEGENRFRVLSSPIIGWEAWETQKDGSRKPIRTPMDKPFSTNDVEDASTIKHFWAMPVWNYNEEKIQILEITQKGVQKSIRALANDVDWGSPINYDLVVTRTGKQLDTEYSVQPKPAKKIDTGIIRLFEDMNINLEALFEGKDPFASDDSEGDQIANDAEKAGL